MFVSMVNVVSCISCKLGFILTKINIKNGWDFEFK